MHLVRFFAVALLLSSNVILVSCSKDNVDAGPASNSVSTASPTPQASPAKPPNYGGALDRVDCAAISGWVWNSVNDNDNIEVEIYADNKLIITVPAKTARTDLKNIGSGNHGFGTTTPPELKDGQPHSVTAKVSGSNYEIKPWEKIKPILTCNPK